MSKLLPCLSSGVSQQKCTPSSKCGKLALGTGVAVLVTAIAAATLAIGLYLGGNHAAIAFFNQTLPQKLSALGMVLQAHLGIVVGVGGIILVGVGITTAAVLLVKRGQKKKRDDKRRVTIDVELQKMGSQKSNGRIELEQQIPSSQLNKETSEEKTSGSRGSLGVPDKISEEGSDWTNTSEGSEGSSSDTQVETENQESEGTQPSEGRSSPEIEEEGEEVEEGCGSQEEEGVKADLLANGLEIKPEEEEEDSRPPTPPLPSTEGSGSPPLLEPVTLAPGDDSTLNPLPPPPSPSASEATTQTEPTVKDTGPPSIAISISDDTPKIAKGENPFIPPSTPNSAANEGWRKSTQYYITVNIPDSKESEEGSEEGSEEEGDDVTY